MSRKGDTRDVLLETAIEVFSRLGYEGASNRVLASTAGVNQALIAYHFGSKQGLYLAVFDEIARRVGSRVDALACSLEGSLEVGRLDPASAASRELARNGIQTLLCRHVRLMMEPDMQSVATLVFREQIEPTEAFQRLWEGAMGRMLRLLTDLVALAEGSAVPRRQHRIRALTLFGQAYVFRSARATVRCHLEEQVDKDLSSEDFSSDCGALIDEVENVIASNVQQLFG